jgi:hypothetical protein
MYTIHGTKKLLDRVKQPLEPLVDEPSTALGDWYATVIFWKPQVALFVNERTLLPVVLSLAPATTLAGRFPAGLHDVLSALGVNPAFVETETRLMAEHAYAKTANRSVVGIMNEFTFLAGHWRHSVPDGDLVALSLDLASTPCSPLYKRRVSPDAELRALVDATT